MREVEPMCSRHRGNMLGNSLGHFTIWVRGVSMLPAVIPHTDCLGALDFCPLFLDPIYVAERSHDAWLELSR